MNDMYRYLFPKVVEIVVFFQRGEKEKLPLCI